MNFNEKCYKLVSKIPKGQITTYKEISKKLNTKAYRAIGNAMSKNPLPICIPCHRVIMHNGSIGGYLYGVKKKIDLLKEEGIKIKNNKIINYKKCMYKFK